ncbi:MAG TPA: HigA family addiction module antitoxin [Microvirga sp.]|jgi:addiction module HigA family antidote|nr:HigA family addiction module antitoxin [Microvirga sp.]
MMDAAPPDLAPLHPGEVQREEFMKPLGVGAIAVARACRVPRTRIERIAAERIGITADTALRLSRCFGTTPQFWLNLQNRFDLAVAAQEIGSALEGIQALDSVSG